MKIVRAAVAVVGAIVGLILATETGDGAYWLISGAFFLVAGQNFEAWENE